MNATITTTIEEADTATAWQLLAELQAEINSRYTDIDTGSLSPTDLQIPRAAFVVARKNGEAVGCGLLRPLADPAYGEIKRMYVRPAWRGLGIGGAILARLEHCAQEFDYHALCLETGTCQPEAVVLYTRAGYEAIPCYQYNPNSVPLHCFEKKLVVIHPESPLHPKLDALWDAKSALSRSLYPAESDYSYGVDELARPHVLFLVAEFDGTFVGCGAAASLGDYGEIKSMFVHEQMRGRRIGERLIHRLEAHLREGGITIARLETGIDSHSAQRLYARMGYTHCGPFGDYPNDPFCIFMEKTL